MNPMTSRFAVPAGLLLGLLLVTSASAQSPGRASATLDSRSAHAGAGSGVGIEALMGECTVNVPLGGFVSCSSSWTQFGDIHFIWHDFTHELLATNFDTTTIWTDAAGQEAFRAACSYLLGSSLVEGVLENAISDCVVTTAPSYAEGTQTLSFTAAFTQLDAVCSLPPCAVHGAIDVL
jgi:hypothetical protein